MHNIKEPNPERNQNGEPIHRDSGAAGRWGLPEEEKKGVATQIHRNKQQGSKKKRWWVNEMKNTLRENQNDGTG